jgi:hypothetical protein
MDRWIVTALCIGGMAFPAVLIVRFGGRRVVVAPSTPLFRSVVVSVESGLIAGLLAGGLGARLFMRVAAAVSPDRAQGLRTAADETVGEITLGGTLFLMLFIGVFGGPALGLIYRAARRFLPLPGALAGIAVIAIPTALLGRPTDLTNPANSDFSILRPTPVIALLIGAYIAFAGASLGATHEWLEQRLPAPSRRPRAVAAYAPAVMAVLSPINVAVALIGTVLIAASERATSVRPRVQRIAVALSGVAGVVVLSDLVRIAT